MQEVTCSLKVLGFGSVKTMNLITGECDMPLRREHRQSPRFKYDAGSYGLFCTTYMYTRSASTKSSTITRELQKNRLRRAKKNHQINCATFRDWCSALNYLVETRAAARRHLQLQYTLAYCICKVKELYRIALYAQSIRARTELSLSLSTPQRAPVPKG
jgi:hypothetical protein